MFIYEGLNSLNLTFQGTLPVDKPDIAIKAYKEGVAVFVGDEVKLGSVGEELDTKSKTLVYQKDEKLFITFNGISGMSSPEVIINQVTDNSYEVTVGDQTKLFVFDGNTVNVEDVQEAATYEPEEVTPVTNEEVTELSETVEDDSTVEE